MIKLVDNENSVENIDNIVKFPKKEEHPDLVQENFEKLLESFKNKKITSYFIIFSDEGNEPNLSGFCDWKFGHRIKLIGGIEMCKLSVLGGEHVIFENK